MLTSFKSALNSAFGLATQCAFCLQTKASNEICCVSCRNLIISPARCRCERCYLPLAEPGICGECQQTSPHFDKIYCLNDYLWPTDALLKNYKYAKQRHLAAPLSQLLWQQLQQLQAPLPEAYCSVPLHWRKHWQRGFNQSELLAQALAKQSDIPLVNVLKRHRYGSSQASLTRRQRQRALKHSFRCQASLPFKHWVVVDDVVTTASTANVIAGKLKHAGATQVDIWAIARTPKA
ncbi:ComF family protein [Agarivorans sp.]|uniref:ComF family protein n=1 Tax=Agarivorans sp. TaxID=1872412 RepID=UPI003CFD4EA3